MSGRKNPMGLGDAILKAEKHIGNEPFAVLLGDDIIVNSQSCTGQLMSVFSRFQTSVISVELLPPEKISSYGIIKGSDDRTGYFRYSGYYRKTDT